MDSLKSLKHVPSASKTFLSIEKVHVLFSAYKPVYGKERKGERNEVSHQGHISEKLHLLRQLLEVLVKKHPHHWG